LISRPAEPEKNTRIFCEIPSTLFNEEDRRERENTVILFSKWEVKLNDRKKNDSIIYKVGIGHHKGGGDMEYKKITLRFFKIMGKRKNRLAFFLMGELCRSRPTLLAGKNPDGGPTFFPLFAPKRSYPEFVS